MIVRKLPADAQPYTNLFGEQYYDDGERLYEPRKNFLGEDVFLVYSYKKYKPV